MMAAMSVSHRNRLPRGRHRDHTRRPADATSASQPDSPAGRATLLSVPLEYVLLAVVTLMMTMFVVAVFVFDIDADRLNKYGYTGLFVVSLISAASIVLPMPGVAAIASAGALLDPLLGLPVPVMVALVAGPAEAIGEATGYAAGYGGSVLFKERPIYPRVKRWMARRGILTMFVLSAFPNPLVDVAGVAAGAVKMPLTQFYAGVLPGKLLKNFYLAAGGLAVGELVQRLLG